MDLMEIALAAEGDPASLIAGAAEPRATRWLALDLLAADNAVGTMLEPAVRAAVPIPAKSS
jgi:hypothetical protein